MFDESNNKLPIKRAISWILLSTLLITGTPVGALLYFKHLRNQMENDSKYNIIAIVQLGSDKDTLKTEYLAELLDLSNSKPTNLYKLSLADAKKRLLKSPLIASVEIKRVKPGTLYIDYRVRKPIAYLADFTNTAVDKDGCLIPFTPFFTPKNLPEIVLGSLENCIWGTQLKGEEFEWALNFLQENPHLNIRRIDLSQYHASSFGRKEVVLVLESAETRILRLSTENIPTQLESYHILDQRLHHDPITAQTLIIDLRIPRLAFVKLWSDL